MTRYFIAFSTAFFIIIFGLVLTGVEISRFKIDDDINNLDLSVNTITYDSNISKMPTKIVVSYHVKPFINYSDEIETGKMKVIVNYYDELHTINKITTINDSSKKFKIMVNAKNNYKMLSKMMKITIEGLKDKKIYDYPKVLSPNIQVFINPADKDSVTVGN